MVKVHTRIKRKLAKPKNNRPSRLKTFKSEESAKKYAETNKIKSFDLIDLSVNPLKPKIKVIKK